MDRRPGGWAVSARWAIALVAIAHAGACGDNLSATDAGAVIVDARRNLDSSVVACGDAAHCAGEAFARVCAAGRCVECTGDGDCDVGEGALGPTCDTAAGYCTCASSTQCATSPLGPVCVPLTGTCGCITPQDCPDGSGCSIEPYLGSGVRTCQEE